MLQLARPACARMKPTEAGFHDHANRRVSCFVQHEWVTSIMRYTSATFLCLPKCCRRLIAVLTRVYDGVLLIAGQMAPGHCRTKIRNHGNGIWFFFLIREVLGIYTRHEFRWIVLFVYLFILIFMFLVLIFFYDY